MAKKRATSHNGHVGGARKHNDRTFAYWKAKHIDPKMTPYNIYVSFASGERIEFNEAMKNAEFYELDGHGFKKHDGAGNLIPTEKGSKALFKPSVLGYYENHYSEALEAQNERHRANRQYKRVRTMDDVLKNKTTAPDECIIQIDNIKTRKDELISAEALQRVTERVIKDMNDWSIAHGNHLHVLTYAIHVDETSPHAHIERIWDCVDDEGHLTIAQDKALEASGIERPDLTEKASLKNNRKMTFDAMYREWVIRAFEAEGYEVNREPIKDTDHKDTKTYSREQYQELMEREEKVAQLEKQVQAEHDANRREKARLDAREADLNAREAAQDARERKQNERSVNLLANEQWIETMTTEFLELEDYVTSSKAKDEEAKKAKKKAEKVKDGLDKCKTIMVNERKDLEESKAMKEVFAHSSAVKEKDNAKRLKGGQFGF